MRRHKINKIKIFSTFVFAGISVLIFLIPGLVKVKEIECRSQFGPCSESLTRKLSDFRDKPLASAKRQITAYLVAEPGIKEFSVRLKLPETLTVTILEKKPRFAVKDVKEEVYANLSEDGEVLAIGKETSLPYVVIPTRPPNLGEKVEEKILFAAKIQERLSAAYDVRSGEIAEDYLKVIVPPGYSVLFPLTGDTDELLGALSLIIYELNKSPEDSRIEQTISTIDLRFTNPVLR